MYNKIFDLVPDGGQGIILPAPKKAYAKTKQMYDSYMHATYIDYTTNDNTRDGLQKSKQYRYVFFLSWYFLILLRGLEL